VLDLLLLLQEHLVLHLLLPEHAAVGLWPLWVLEEAAWQLAAGCLFGARRSQHNACVMGLEVVGREA
jgi:hypothetical protein